MAMGLTQLLTEMSIGIFLGDKGRPVRKADNLTAICEPIVWRKCGRLDLSQPYGPAQACYKESFTLYLFIYLWFI
jgi:hypothetical protein